MIRTTTKLLKTFLIALTAISPIPKTHHHPRWEISPKQMKTGAIAAIMKKISNLVQNVISTDTVFVC